jgi:hypothetical protein
MKKKTMPENKKGISASTLFKFSILIFTLGLMSTGVFANPHLATKQQIGMFKNSRTCVVLETGSISYNVYITDAVQKYWKSTEFEIIDEEKFELRRHDSKYSFIVLMKGVYDNDPGGISYNYMSLVLGDPAFDITEMPEFCSFPLSYSDDNDADYGYVIPAMVKFMQKHVNNLENNRFMISLNGLKYYNSMISFKDKMLLLNKNTLAPEADSPEKINIVYPYYVKLVEPAEMQEEINAGSVNTLFNFHVGPASNTGSGKCFEMIFDNDGFLRYYAYRMVTNEKADGFNLENFKQLR